MERDLLQQNNNNDDYQYVIGSDESGTGCIAGPVVAVSCCIVAPFDVYKPLDTVQDGKKLTVSDCQRVYQHVVAQHPEWYQWKAVFLSAAEIDEGGRSVQDSTQDAFRESILGVVDQVTTTTSMEGIKTNPQSPTPPRFYSIVDGPKSPTKLVVSNKHPNNHCVVRSRPWKGADAVVYTVALASCLARALQNQWMRDNAEARYPQYAFATHGGYPTRSHLALLHRHGPCPIHRRSCRPVRDRRHTTVVPSSAVGSSSTSSTTALPRRSSNRADDTTIRSNINKDSDSDSITDSHTFMDRKSFVGSLGSAAAAAMLLGGPPVVQPAFAMTNDPKTGIALPDPGEIESSVNLVDWSKMDNPVLDVDRPFARLDTSNDALFYQEPRFVEHVDEQAVRRLTDYVASVVQGKKDDVDGGGGGSAPTPRAVLDLCSSWTSHIPNTNNNNNNNNAPQQRQRVAGLGMNAAELQANPSLTEWTVQDLNENPVLPYANNSFDVVLCQLSIDYLTQPLAVCREVARVLKPGTGTVHILFSNRLFLSKAVALWTGKDDVDHAFLVASYLQFGGGMEDIRARDLSVRNKRGRIVGDPLYVVTGRKVAA